MLASFWSNATYFLQRWLKQALEEEGSTSPGGGRPSLLMPSESPLSPSINGESYSPLPLNGSCSLPGESVVLVQLQFFFLQACLKLFLIFLCPNACRVAYPVEEKTLMFARSLYVGDFNPIWFSLCHPNPNRVNRSTRHTPAASHASSTTTRGTQY